MIHGVYGIPIGFVAANMLLIALDQLDGPWHKKWDEVKKRRREREQSKAD